MFSTAAPVARVVAFLVLLATTHQPAAEQVTETVAKAVTLSSGAELTWHPAPPDEANGTAVLICPGGGYGALMMSYEGHDIAAWLNGMGVTGAVLRYHIAPNRHPAAFDDAVEAIRLMRTTSKEHGIDPSRIGVIGFSAGGHLASMLGTQAPGSFRPEDGQDLPSARPDFLMLVYPVISMMQDAHAGSRKNLLGPEATEEQAAAVSSEKHVTKDSPPVFIVHSRKDTTVPVSHSERFAAACKEAGVPCEFLLLEEGGHGLGAGKGAQWKAWQDAAGKWLETSGYLAKPVAP